MLAVMQTHYGNIGSALQGVGVIAVAIGALIKGRAVVRAWMGLDAKLPVALLRPRAGCRSGVLHA
jgi:hypothetical protein